MRAALITAGCLLLGPVGGVLLAVLLVAYGQKVMEANES